MKNEDLSVLLELEGGVRICHERTNNGNHMYTYVQCTDVFGEPYWKMGQEIRDARIVYTILRHFGVDTSHQSERGPGGH